MHTAYRQLKWRWTGHMLKESKEKWIRTSMLIQRESESDQSAANTRFYQLVDRIRSRWLNVLSEARVVQESSV
ncbi:hypothetical protein EVAR_71217_1 [Eumeta japonica]|uniref:Uncharacterized protein n=1 Tax=Eumeta variegata TaxID=151549 RepID=A0A4C2A6I3_EUMVA|nr:hypothetical protein EVAR_71217_1 [Eumeta japonica]